MLRRSFADALPSNKTASLNGSLIDQMRPAIAIVTTTTSPRGAGPGLANQARNDQSRGGNDGGRDLL